MGYDRYLLIAIAFLLYTAIAGAQPIGERIPCSQLDLTCSLGEGRCYVLDPVAVSASEDTFIPRIAVNATITLAEIWTWLHTGGTATIDLQKCPSNTSCAGIGGLTGVGVSTAAAFTTPSAPTTLVRGDSLQLVVTGITATPRNMTVCIYGQ